MHFDFIEMLAADLDIQYPRKVEEGRHFITNLTGKNLVGINITGQPLSNQSFAAQFTLDYVQFSARSFPDILVPLMNSIVRLTHQDHSLFINRCLFSLKKLQWPVDPLDNSELKLMEKEVVRCSHTTYAHPGKPLAKTRKTIQWFKRLQDDVMDQLTNDYLDKKKRTYSIKSGVTWLA